MQSLISAQWLADHLDDPRIAIIDASAHLPGAGRDPAAEFEAGALPGARFLDLPSLFDPASPVPKAVPTRAQVEERLRALGISSDQMIVLYDASRLRTSARAWWILHTLGAEKVAILDGGLEHWQALGLPTAPGRTDYPAARFTLPETANDRLRSKAQMLANCTDCGEQVVDARDAARFAADSADEVHGLPGGHIPGARNLFFRDLLHDDGTFRAPVELESAFAAAGIDPEKPLVASCGSGVTACVILFAHHLLGHSHGALYDGSWSEWGSDPDLPRETGKAAVQ